jgi:3',5'-nucleoside bisphosphate phosphatase
MNTAQTDFLEQSDKALIDLHIHSNHSDGLLNPAQIVEVARERHLAAISITDHDALSAVRPAIQAGVQNGIEVIPGIELSSSFNGNEIHILGYFLDVDNPVLGAYVKQFLKSREERAHKILALLGKHGIHIPFELVKRKVNGGCICRPHIADVMVEEGFCFSHYEAFEKYLGEDKCAFVPKETLEPAAAVRLIQNAGGLAFLAHPAIGRARQILHRLREFGFDGLEIFHPKHTIMDISYFNDIARRSGLLASGGSDCHGARPGEVIIGTLKIPYRYLMLIKGAALRSELK